MFSIKNVFVWAMVAAIAYGHHVGYGGYGHGGNSGGHGGSYGGR